jgi:signal-transduction protein with cAMP-binding, CBS, and nucleotidyltransferase domain
MKVSDLQHHELFTAQSELADAADLMLELGIRHLPVVRSGRLVGVLSMRDLLDADHPRPPSHTDPAPGGRSGRTTCEPAT